MQKPGGPDGPKGVPHRAKDPAARWADAAPKPENYVPPTPTVMDEMLAGLKSPADVADGIVDAAYGPLKQYCSLPQGFASRELGYDFRRIQDMSPEQLDELSSNPPSVIIDPKAPQVEAVELMQKFLRGDGDVCEASDPFQPRFGANFRGKPGCGKTHIMSAFARNLKEMLDGKLGGYRTMVAQFVSREYVAYQVALSKTGNADVEGSSVWQIDGDLGDVTPDDAKAGIGERKSLLSLAMAQKGKGEGEVKETKAPGVVFQAKLAQFQASLARMQYQPPDLLYLDFESLWELCREGATTRAAALDAIIRAKVLFLDDVHPKGDIERTQIVLHVIEGRYAAGRFGTFMTTNLTNEEIAGKDETHIAERLQSRCNEMFYEVDFKDCIDWRTEVRQRRIKIVRDDLQQRVTGLMAPHLDHPADQTS